jgi:hypothetical protein
MVLLIFWLFRRAKLVTPLKVDEGEAMKYFWACGELITDV